ncbi:2-dehydropantoate 2-reductase [Xanthocytophaga agilis]|uniref:2-dehydropantoate 2-reductase n=1 Tax=Xanthocytophaga agilis TaxID=3048010 RepID=A0AAE3R1G1_9BACT|nr:2-dehydropantoate 2-reductase [Xanthocytophaga agilis]MDJ1499584.1 2-dehydropantoate 2-reductase [Xanthocytophaga agilis]
MNQTIYIIGAGAIGKALAVFLKKQGKTVILLRGSVDTGSSSTETIQVTLSDQTIVEASVEVETLSNLSELKGIIVLTNKSYGNTQLAQKLKGKTGNSPIVILQNGLGIENPFEANGFPDIYRCVLFATSQVISEWQVRFKPVTVSPIGIIQHKDSALSSIVDQLTSSYFPFRVEANIQPVIWKKAIINSVFNSVCPLLDSDNGIFHRNEKALAIAQRVIRECLAIANTKGIDLPYNEVTEGLLQISRFSDGQLISTLQDIKNNRPTEIDTLNFEIVRIAQTLNKESFVRETQLLGELTLLKSEIGLQALPQKK